MNIENARNLIDVFESELEIYNQSSYDKQYNKIEIDLYMKEHCPNFIANCLAMKMNLESLEKINDPTEMLILLHDLIHRLLTKKKDIDAKIKWNYENNLLNGRRWKHHKKTPSSNEDSENSDSSSGGSTPAKCLTEKDKKDTEKIPKNDSLAH